MTTEMNVALFSGTSDALLFEKRTVSELSELEMMQVDGGGTPAIGFTIAATVFIGGAIVGYYYNIP